MKHFLPVLTVLFAGIGFHSPLFLFLSGIALTFHCLRDLLGNLTNKETVSQYEELVAKIKTLEREQASFQTKVSASLYIGKSR